MPTAKKSPLLKLETTAGVCFIREAAIESFAIKPDPSGQMVGELYVSSGRVMTLSRLPALALAQHLSEQASKLYYTDDA